MTTSFTQPPDTLLGRYLTVTALDTSAPQHASPWGQRWQGQHIILQRAIRLFLLPMDTLPDEATRRFKSLIQELSTIRALHLDPPFQDQRWLGAAMAWLEGPAPTTWLAQQNPPRQPLVAQALLTQLVKTLTPIHAAGVVIGNLHPNMWTRVEVDDEPTWALADPLGLRLSAPNLAAGATPDRIITHLEAPYLAPEWLAFTRDDIDVRADVYSLGTLLYECCTGQPPFRGEDPVHTALAHAEAPLPSARDLNPQVPPALDRVIQTAMAKDPEARFNDLDALLVALNNPDTCPVPHDQPERWRADAERWRARLRGEEVEIGRDTLVDARVFDHEDAVDDHAAPLITLATVKPPDEDAAEQDAPGEDTPDKDAPADPHAAPLITLATLGEPAHPPPDPDDHETPDATDGDTLTPLGTTDEDWHSSPATATRTPASPPPPDPISQQRARKDPAQWLARLLIALVLGVGLGVLAIWQLPGLVGGPPLPAVRHRNQPAEGLLARQLNRFPQRERDMVVVPAGVTHVGLSPGLTPWQPSIQPPHDIFVSAFVIDRHEVSVADYTRCVEATRCTPPVLPSTTPADVDATQLPVTGVTWDQANTFCSYVNLRLPTEVEWERAARGPFGWPYPWGLEAECGHGHLGGACVVNNTSQPRPVDDSRHDVSPYGVVAMAGNVWEWTADHFESPQWPAPRHLKRDPVGPDEGTGFVIKGGDFSRGFVTMADRTWNRRAAASPRGGFRCAKTLVVTTPHSADHVLGRGATPNRALEATLKGGSARPVLSYFPD